MSKSDAKLIAGLAGLAVLCVSLAVFLVWLIVDQSNYYEELQRKQDVCLKAGGMWIDNRSTEGYCYFNK